MQFDDAMDLLSRALTDYDRSVRDREHMGGNPTALYLPEVRWEQVRQAYEMLRRFQDTTEVPLPVYTGGPAHPLIQDGR